MLTFELPGCNSAGNWGSLTNVYSFLRLALEANIAYNKSNTYSFLNVEKQFELIEKLRTTCR